MSKICVIGTGYVGLVTATGLAELGHQVTGIDVIPEKIASLTRGELPIYEPDLGPLLSKHLTAGRIRFTTSYEEGLGLSGAEGFGPAEFIFIAVGTPTASDGHSADLHMLEAAATTIGNLLDHSAVIITKSTVPVGSGDVVKTIVNEHLTHKDVIVDVVSNPEFLREGSAVSDFLHPDRIVLGSSNQEAAQKVAQLYIALRAPMVITDLYTAEMIKYASNAFLATKISFVNEIAQICERLGADVREVAAGMGYDKRIGRAFLDAGLGYGGSCFPKDVRALAHMADEAGLHPQLLHAVMDINHGMREMLLDKITALLGGLRGATVGLWGLAFKPNTDDMRDAPAIDLIKWLTAQGATVKGYDPVAQHTASAAIGNNSNMIFCEDPYEVASEADAVVLVTEWAEFTRLDFARVRSLMKQSYLLDGRNVLDGKYLTSLGFTYRGIGRPLIYLHESNNNETAAQEAKAIAAARKA